MKSGIPIAVFAYNRLEPLQKTLSVLEQAHGYPGGPVVIYCDGPKPNDPKDQEEVDKLQDWLEEWAKRRSHVQLMFSDVNRGLRQSITSGVADQLADNEAVIVLEDDIIVSRSFLDYMHWSLHTYSRHERVAQISGYFVPHRRRLPDLGFLTVPACWGWGTWRRAWELYNDDAKALHQSFHQDQLKEFNIDGTYAYYESLSENAAGRQNTWMVRWYASIFPMRMLTLYPKKSMTRNIGFLYSGTNCVPGPMERVFSHQSITNALPKTNGTMTVEKESTDYRNALTSFYRWQSEVWATPSAKQRWMNRIRRWVRSIVPK